MISSARASGFALVSILAAGISSLPGAAQSSVTPSTVDTARPIAVKSEKPKHAGTAKFEGYVQHANIAQITVRAKGNELDLQTFPLSQAASQKMQKIVDKGGYQYGDKVTIFYDPVTMRALKVKGKPSKPI